MTTSFSFGNSSNAPAPTSLFGTTPTITSNSNTTSLFGATNNTTGNTNSSGGGLFGSTSLFGSNTSSSNAPAAPATPFSFATPAAPSSLFGGSNAFQPPPPPLQQQPQLQNNNMVTPQPPKISGNMYYSQLTPDMKQAIDMIYNSMMEHKKTMFQLQTIGPQLLQTSTASERNNNNPFTMSTTAGTTTAVSKLTPLQEKIQQLLGQLHQLYHHDMKQLQDAIQKQYHASEQANVQTTIYATWPVEGLAARMGIILPLVHPSPPPPDHRSTNTTTTSIDGTNTKEDEKKSEDMNLAHYQEVQAKIRQALTLGMAAVDRIDRMPSPYYWDTIQGLELRTSQLTELIATAKVQQERIYEYKHKQEWNIDTIQEMIEYQHVLLRRLQQHQIPLIQDAMELLKLRYRHSERSGENIFDIRKLQEQERQKQVQEQILMQYLQAASTTSATANANGGINNSNNNSNSTAPSTSLFPTNPTNPPAPLFGGTSTTTNNTASTSTTGLFGSGGGASAAPPSFNFNNSSTNASSSTTAATATNNSNNNTFGSSTSTTPAAAPTATTTTNLFGATTQPPAATALSFPTFGAGGTTTTTPAFGSNAAATTTTTVSTSNSRKTKSNSRIGSRRR